jgi:DNA-binding MarR family transcriptional regulator
MPSAATSTAPLAPHELAAWRGVLEVHARATQQLDAQMRCEHGLSLSAYEVLMFLADAPEHRMRMSEIARRVLLSRSGCTRLVDRLVEQGYVTRCAATCDRRGLYAELTDAGLEKITAARVTHWEGIRRFFLDHLTATDLIALGDIWTRFRADRDD